MGNVIKSDRVRLVPKTADQQANQEATCAKTVRLLKLDGEVHAIELTCTCGERTVIELAYVAGEKP
jgi:hypothetical protein